MAQESKKKPKLRDISRLHPTTEEEERLRAKIAAAGAPPIVVAIVGQSIVEVELERQLRDCFRRRDEKTWEKLTDDRAPLGTFSQKIVAAYAFGLINETVRDWLDSIRHIRNAFAHAKTEIDFKNEAVVYELRHLTLPSNPRSRAHKHVSLLRQKDQDPQECYVGLCYITLQDLVRKRSKRFKAMLGAKLKRKERRVSALEKGIRDSAQESPTNALAWFLANQSGGPKTGFRRVSLFRDILEAGEHFRKPDK